MPEWTSVGQSGAGQPSARRHSRDLEIALGDGLGDRGGGSSGVGTVAGTADGWSSRTSIQFFSHRQGRLGGNKVPVPVPVPAPVLMPVFLCPIVVGAGELQRREWRENCDGWLMIVLPSAERMALCQLGQGVDGCLREAGGKERKERRRG
jgi:hypothetical protein